MEYAGWYEGRSVDISIAEKYYCLLYTSDIRQKLIAQGMPADQIAFIHEANTEVRKKELFSKVRTCLLYTSPWRTITA